MENPQESSQANAAGRWGELCRLAELHAFPGLSIISWDLVDEWKKIYDSVKPTELTILGDTMNVSKCYFTRAIMAVFGMSR